jgi:orotate phosphoribosyltransferase
MTSTQNTKELVEILLQSGALLTGDFELKSGKRSPYFVDFGKIPGGASLDVLGRCYANKIVTEFDEDSFDLVFGPAYKAIPIAVATVIALYRDHGIDKRYAFNRKVEKNYGEKSRFLGVKLAPRTRVLILDDVITDGGTKYETLDLLAEYTKVAVVGVVVGVDRSEDPEVLARFKRQTGLDLTSLCTIGDIDAVLSRERVAA